MRSIVGRWLTIAAALVAAGGAAAAAPGPEPLLRIEPGPVAIAADFPDPFILRNEQGYFAFATNRGGTHPANVQIAWSKDLAAWRLLALDALPELPAWAKRGFTWAPEVLALDGRYLLYFTARHAKSGRQCVGVAVSDRARGPYVSSAAEPLVCQFDHGGTIDASPFRDADGALYLYYKNDGNHPDFREPTWIYGQRLAPDGLSLTGEAAKLLRNDADWERHVIEAPTMLRHGADYVMFFSANDYGWPDHAPRSPYAIGYAICAGPLGPCADAPGNPVLTSEKSGPAGCLSGPGHQSVFEADGKTLIAFHAWHASKSCLPLSRQRFLHFGQIEWER